jgi:RNA polymerase sigma factor (TIGR02999 family)
MAAENESPTKLLEAWRAGDAESGTRLFSIVYGELHRIAKASFWREAPDHTLQPTALVHELYLRLFASSPVQYQDRAHFLAVAARNMRRILIDHARAAGRLRRGGLRVQVTLTEAIQANAEGSEIVTDLIDLDEALEQLAAIDPRASRVVELRFLAGLTEKETAEVLGISIATLRRDWTYGRTWLVSHLNG